MVSVCVRLRDMCMEFERTLPLSPLVVVRHQGAHDNDDAMVMQGGRCAGAKIGVILSHQLTLLDDRCNFAANAHTNTTKRAV